MMLRRLEELQDLGVLKRGALAYIPGRGPRRLGDLQQLGVPVGGCIGIYIPIFASSKSIALLLSCPFA